MSQVELGERQPAIWFVFIRREAGDESFLGKQGSAVEAQDLQ
jgi:hypothetical protein